MNCSFCNRKLKIIEETVGICKCKLFFCNTHKIPETHNCTFNYLEEHQKRIENKSKKIESEKIKMI